MRQSENKRRENTFIAGVGSITGLLKQIHDETVSGNDILKSIETHVDESINYTQLSLTGILNNQVLHTSLTYKTNVILGQINYGVQMLLSNLFNSDNLKKSEPNDIKPQTVTEVVQQPIQLNSLEPILDVLNDIRSILFKRFNMSKDDLQEKPVDVVNNEEENKSSMFIRKMSSLIVDSKSLFDSLSIWFDKLNMSVIRTNQLLESVVDKLVSIYLYLPSLAGGNKESKIAEQRSNDFVKLAESIVTFAEGIDKTFLLNFEKFVDLYERFISNDNSKKLGLTTAALTSFTATLKILGIFLKPTVTLFQGITTALMKLTFFLILPFFSIGMGILIAAMKGLRAAIGDDNVITGMIMSINKLSLSLVKITLAMYLISKLDFSSIMKFMLVLASLASVMRLFNKKQETQTNIFPTQNVKIQKKFGVGGIFSAAIGIALLVLAVASVESINFAKTSALLVFLVGFAGAMFILRKSEGKTKGTTIFGMAIGMSLLVLSLASLAEINWSGTKLLLGFIVGLGLALFICNKLAGGNGKTTYSKISKNYSFGMTGITGFAFGIALLVLTIDAVNEVSWSGAIQLILFVTSISFAIRIAGGKSAPRHFTQFAFGIALLVLTVAAASEVNWMPAFKLIGFIFGISLALKFLQEMNISPKRTLTLATTMSLSIALIGGALWLISGIEINKEQLGLFGLTVLSFATLMTLLGRMEKVINNGANVIKKMTLSMLISAAAIYLISQINLNFKTIMLFYLTNVLFVSLTLMVNLINAGKRLEQGSITIMFISAAMFIAAIALNKVCSINMNWENFLSFMGVIVIMSATMLGLSFIVIPVLFGAVSLIAIGVATLVAAISIFAISQLTYPKENIDNFFYAVKTLSLGFFTMLPQIILGTVGALLFAGIAATTLVTCLVLQLMSLLSIKQEKIDSFGDSMVSLIDAYNELGLISVGKAVIKSGMMLPIVLITWLTAIVMDKISKLQFNRNSMETFGIVLKDFLHYTTEAINGSIDALKNVEPGLNALGKLVSVAGNLVDVVEAYSNMKIGEWKVVDGKLQLVGYKKIDETMMKQVGKGIGTLLACLIEPLTIISSDSDEWNFGNGPIKNPFKGGFFGTDKNSGIKRIEKIGNAFSTLINVMKGISENQLLTAEKSTFDNFKSTFNTYIQMLIENINKISGVKTKGIDDKAEDIADFYNTINSIQETKTKSMSEDIHQLINELSDNVKWQNINNNLNRLDKNVKSIVSNINKLNIDKAVALERNLRLFTQARTVEGINECIEQLKELVGIVVEQQEKQTQSQNNIATTLGDWFGSNNEQKQNNVQEKETKQIELKQSDNNLDEIVNILNQALNGINQKLNGTLKVQLVNGNSINFMNN